MAALSICCTAECCPKLPQWNQGCSPGLVKHPHTVQKPNLATIFTATGKSTRAVLRGDSVLAEERSEGCTAALLAAETCRA